MNRSRGWTVHHEAGGSNDSLEKFNKRLHDRYGEVNSFPRFFFNEVEVTKKGMIIRHPMQILASSYSRRPTLYTAERISEGLRMIDDGIKRGATIVEFKRFGDMDYLQSLVESFGITDLKINPKMLGAVNVSKRRRNPPPDMIEEGKEKFKWFMEKYHDRI
jgi:hypothetical protein